MMTKTGDVTKFLMHKAKLEWALKYAHACKRTHARTHSHMGLEYAHIIYKFVL